MPKLKEAPGPERKSNVLPFIHDGEFYFTKGVEAFQKLKFEIAAKWLKKAVEFAPNEPLYQCQLSIIYTEIGYFHAANDLLRNVAKNSQNRYPDCYYLLANNYAHLGLLNEAKRYALLYLEEGPESEFYKATEELLELIDIDDDSDDIEIEEEDELLLYQETVFGHLEHLEWKEAIPVLEEMLERFPNHSLTKHDYAHALFQVGEKERAIDYEENLLEEEPNTLYSHLNLAYFYHEVHEREKSQKIIESVQNIYPMHEEQKLRIAITLARTKNDALALQRFSKLRISFVKSHPSYYRWYSRTCFKQGQIQKAEQIWQDGCKTHLRLQSEQKPWLM